MVMLCVGLSFPHWHPLEKTTINVGSQRTATVGAAFTPLAFNLGIGPPQAALRDHNQTLGLWYALYAGWTDAPLRGEW
eukprot:5496333-Pleurochrysis_carterae.AAC.1